MQNNAANAQDNNPPSIRAAIIAAAAGNVLDGLSTVAALKDDSVREANPLLGQDRARILVMKGLFMVPQVVAVKYLGDHGHPTVARWLGYSIGAFGAGLAIHNLHVRSSIN